MKVLKRLTSIVIAVALTLSIVTVVVPTAEADTLPNYVKFEGTEEFTIAMEKVGDAPDVTLQYSTDGTQWNDYDNSTRPAISSGENKVVYFRGTNTRFASETDIYNHYVINPENNGTVAVTGNIMALLNYQNPSITITAKYTFNALFDGCTSITSAPELPAETLYLACYNCMFYGCTSLTSAPKLPATTLAEGCYRAMFEGCTSLINAPNLPAETLTKDCYRRMFEDCTSLTSVSELPATTLETGCYEMMFKGCTSLKVPPELKATTLKERCYAEMFYGCSSLSMEETTDARKALWVIPSNSEILYYYDMIYGTSGSTTSVEPGKMYKLAKFLPNYVKFEGTEEFTIQVAKYGSAPSVTLQYSTDGENWSDYSDADRPTISSSNKVLYFRGTNNTFATSATKHNYFVITPSNSGTVAASGNIMALLNNTSPATTLNSKNTYAFCNLFKNCTALTSAPDLPATTLAQSCYYGMFRDCTALTSAPELKATTLAQNCYSAMFRDCTALTSAPELKATTLATSCYYNMFNGCSKLKMEETTDASKALWVMPSASATMVADWNRDMLKGTSGTATSVAFGKMYKSTASAIYTVESTKYFSAADLNADIADGTVAEESTIVLTGGKPDGTVVLDGKDMTIDGSGIATGIVLPDNGVLVSATNKARVNVLGTMPTTAKDNTADAPIYSEGFIYLGADASSKTLTTTGSVYQAKTVADFVTAGAVVSDVISFNVTAEVAPKTGDEIAIVAKEGAASATTFNEKTGLYEVTINGIYLSHAGNDLGLSVKANDTAVETKDAYSTVSYISDAAKLSGTTDTMKTLLANLVIACKYINDRGTGNKGTAINLSAAGLEWIEGAKTEAAPAAKSMTIDSSAQNIRFSGAGLHVTEKLNVYVKVEPRDGATEVPAGTYVKTYINNGSGYELIDVADDSVRGDGNKQWYAYIDKLLPTQFNSDIKVELYTSEDVLAQTLVYSVNTYCSQMSSQYSDLCTAIYNYGTAAEAAQK